MSHRLRTAALGCFVVLLLSGCASETPEDRIDELCADDLVVACEGGDGWLVLTIGDQADEHETLDIARRLHDEAAAANLGSGATLKRESTTVAQLDPEVQTPMRWELTVYPGEISQIELTLTDIVAAAIPGTLGISVDGGGWPSVKVIDLSSFDEVFQTVSSTELFEAGGTYTLFALEERLRIVHVPGRTADVAIQEVIDLARSYPAAEVLLEAPTAGPQYPTLYVARLTPEEVIEVDARLRDQRLADADVDGYPLEFVLGTTGAEGVTYTGGTFGNVPSS